MNEEKPVIPLSAEDVKNLHYSLSSHYYLLKEMEPVTPTGVKDMNMLLSAVGRQQTSYNGQLVYNTPYSNCATLVFGIVKNHAFHNGNKRVGFLCLLKHLYNNNLVLNTKVSNSEIYELLKQLASNNLKLHATKYYKKDYKKYLENWNSNNDNEETLKYLGFWIKQNSVNKNNFIKNELKIIELKRIVESKHLIFSQFGAKIKIEKDVPFLKKVFGTKTHSKEYSLGNTLTTVKKEIIKNIRKDFDLSDENGFDNASFYSEDFIDEEIRNYKVILNKLSKT
jgi:death-on-curing protein